MIWLLLAMLAAPTPRDPKNVRRYRAQHPCPEYLADASGKTVSCALYKRKPDGKFFIYWKCGGCDVDHLQSLKCGGADVPENMHWMDSKANRSKGAGVCQ